MTKDFSRLNEFPKVNKRDCRDYYRTWRSALHELHIWCNETSHLARLHASYTLKLRSRKPVQYEIKWLPSLFSVCMKGPAHAGIISTVPIY